MDNLRFGTAGIPFSTKQRNTINGIKRVKELGLDAMELEFVRGINITKDKTPEVKRVTSENDVILTCHSPYFINLNSDDKKKYYASISYIKNSAIITSLCGGYSICFHPGFYQKIDLKKVYEKIKEAIKTIVNSVKDEGHEIWIRPETAGKITQFGNLNELFNLSSELDMVLPCIDFSHLHAITNGKYNSKDEFREIFILMEKKLGRKALDNVHFHCQGIEYSEKGEKWHLNLKDSDFRFMELLNVWKEFKLKGIVICESPNIEEDALLLKNEYKKIL